MSSRGKKVKRVLLAVAALVGVGFVWHVAWRATGPLRAARVVSASDAPGRAEEGQPSPALLRLGTYNIAHGRGLADTNWVGRDGEAAAKRLGEIAELLASEKLDVVVLNEADFGCTWTRGVNQAETIARAAGFPYRAEGRNLDVCLPFFAFRYGNAVLSRFPIVEARAVDYPAYSRFEAAIAGKKRGLLCTLELPGGKRLRILAVHLEHRSEETRAATVPVIAALAADGGPPLVAVGDFNSPPENYPCATKTAEGRTALSLLLASGRFAAVRAQPSAADFTYPSNNPRTVIDWILVPPDWKTVSQRVLDSQLSDHRPLVAEVEP